MSVDNDKKRSFLKLTIGGPSVVLLFGVIVLAYFAVLSVRAAYSELWLARRSYEAAVNYYNADAECELELLRIVAESSDYSTEEYVNVRIDDMSYIAMCVGRDEDGKAEVIYRKFVAEPVSGYSDVGFEINNMFEDGEPYDY